ncbi:hypothetical protein [Pseudonocardia zijingensis]|uniref:hypothetical protein n=1 Tax=Pseudonocardia zijingensis TaxID=153376 RepID=UPI0031DBBD46
MSRTSSAGGADGPATEVFTAVSILNREGHPPVGADRSAQAQHRRDAEPGAEPEKSGRSRRGAIAGGAGLAGGVAVGVAAFAGGSEPAPGEMVAVAADGGEGAYPGQGLLDLEDSADAPLEPVAIDPAANTGALDEATPVVSPGAPAAGPAPAAAPASADPGGPDAAPAVEDDTAFGSGSDDRADESHTDDGDAGDHDTGDGDAGGGNEGGLLGAGSDDGVLGTGLLAADDDSSGDDSSGDESSGDSGGDGGGVLGTGLLG